jgi:TPR repeat protein
MLGIACASAADPDRVNAHKWFNLAAIRGNREAARYRQELALEMSPAEVVAAQRAAREWAGRMSDARGQRTDVRGQMTSR